ncbi:MAG TPA: hypothetical protein GX528_00115 [Firmicutes bacterium]|nr:hypothetical protein [Bacillota bacterium]
MGILAIYPQTSHLQLALEAAGRRVFKEISLAGPLSGAVEREIARWLKDSTDSLQVIVTTRPPAPTDLQEFKPVTEGLLRKTEAAGAGLQLAHRLGVKFNAPAYLFDPVSEGHFDRKAFVSGTPEISRPQGGGSFIFTYLARLEAEKRGIPFQTARFVIANLDSEFLIGAFKKGAAVDAAHSSEEGPFSLRQSGTLPYDALLDLCSAAADKEEALRRVNEESGLFGYLGTEDLAQLAAPQAAPIKEALVYQIAKEIGAYAGVLKGQLDAIILGGELLQEKTLAAAIKERVEFLGDVVFYPGAQSLKALLAAGRRALQNETLLS